MDLIKTLWNTYGNNLEDKILLMAEKKGLWKANANLINSFINLP